MVAETGVVTDGSSLMHGLLGSAVPPHRLLMLTLEGYCELSDAGLLSVVSHCKKLRTLRLVRCGRVTSSGLRVALGALPFIRQLGVSGCGGLCGETLEQVRAEYDILLHCYACPQISRSLQRQWRSRRRSDGECSHGEGRLGGSGSRAGTGLPFQ